MTFGHKCIKNSRNSNESKLEKHQFDQLILNQYAQFWHQNVQEDISNGLQSLSTSVTIISKIIKNSRNSNESKLEKHQFDQLILNQYAQFWHQNVQEDISNDLQSLSASVTVISQNAMC